MTIIIDGTVGANKGVVLDSNGKLPAIDGSQVTALSATQITTGTVATARLDTGTTAGKVLVLDGSGNMPAIDGSLMTGVASATKSASNPTVSTNPATGLGTKWINTTTGDVYILTDATAGANVWTNTGAGTGDIEPWYWQGTQYGITAGGYQNPPNQRVNNIQKISFTSDGNATDQGNLTNTRSSAGAGKGPSYGYVAGGSTGSYVNTIDRYLLATMANAVDVGDLTHAWAPHGGAGSTTHGYVCGGYSTLREDSIEKWAYAASSNATDVGNLTQARSNGATQTSTTHGYSAGGYEGGAPNSQWDIIDKWAFSSDGNATDVGDLVVATEGPGGCSSQTYGYVSSGKQGGAPVVTTIQKFAFASDGNASNVGNVTAGRYYQGQNCSSLTYGYHHGGYTGSSSDVIDKWAFATDGTASDIGNLVVAVSDNPGIGY